MALQGQRFCPCCGQIKSLQNFITDYREKDKYLPFCKTCTDRIVLDASGNEVNYIGIWSAAMVNNVPMIKFVWDEACKVIAQTNPKSPFATYYRLLREKFGKYEGVWQSDCWMGDFVKILVTNVKGETIPDTDEMIALEKEWGKFVDQNGEYDLKAYEFLVSRYEDYTSSVQNLTNAMIMQYKNLCKAEWLKIKADESGDIGEVSKAQKLLDNLYSQLKLDDFAVEKSDVDRFIDKLIQRIEETEPAELEDEEKYTDIMGNEYLYNSFMRSMRNMIAGTRDYPDIPKEEM